MALDRHIATGGHLVRLSVEHTLSGWDVREEVDRRLVYVEHHDEWEKVEWAVTRLERDARRGDYNDVVRPALRAKN